jgi:hypothetical protein
VGLCRYANDEKIQRADRLLFRGRSDLKRTFVDPFGHGDDCAFYHWLQAERQRAAA